MYQTGSLRVDPVWSQQSIPFQVSPSDKSALHCVTGDSTIPPPDPPSIVMTVTNKERAHFERPPFAHCHIFGHRWQHFFQLKMAGAGTPGAKWKIRKHDYS